MTDMNLFDQMNRALGGGLDKGVHIEAMGAAEMEAITEAQVVPAGEDAGGVEVDPLAAAMARAVQQQEGWYGNDGGGPDRAPTPTATGTPPSNTPPTGNSLNAGVAGDDALTTWLNNM